jgi:hypothetical protein
MIKATLLLALGIGLASVAGAQNVGHEPTSATDGEVRIHKEKRSMFRSPARNKKRATEREGQSLQSSRFKPEIKDPHRHGKPIRKAKTRSRHRNWNESKVFQKHAAATRREGSRSRRRSN